MNTSVQSPWELFDQWQEWNRESSMAGIMTLSTVNSSGQPSSRIVNFRGVELVGNSSGEIEEDPRILFFTNYRSRKAQDIESNPKGALLFYYPERRLQIRVEGCFEKLLPQRSDEYFASRPKLSQIGAHVSPQSERIDSREGLIARFDEYEARFQERELPRPSHWGGYGLAPRFFEFWEGKPNRLHHRRCFKKRSNGGWEQFLLGP